MHGSKVYNSLYFLCPHCRKVWLSCKRATMGMREQMELFEAAVLQEEIKVVVPMKESVIWQMKGAFKKGNFTVSPSIHAGASGHWHGHIQNGHCTGA